MFSNSLNKNTAQYIAQCMRRCFAFLKNLCSYGKMGDLKKNEARLEEKKQASPYPSPSPHKKQRRIQNPFTHLRWKIL